MSPFVEHEFKAKYGDNWVAYARQLHDQGDLPAGGFETQFTFALMGDGAKF